MVTILGIPAFAGRIEHIDLRTLETPTYTVEGDAFVRHNGDRYCNRPLYCNDIPAVAFGGDKPYTMVGNGKTILGNLMFALIRAGNGKWLQSASDITSKYRPGRMEWIVKDISWGTTTVHIEVVPTAQGPGVAAHIRLDDSLPGDTLVWASGAAFQTRASVLSEWDMTTPGGPFPITRGFVPADCQGNVVQVNGQSWSLQTKGAAEVPTSEGVCSAASNIRVADASAWKDPAVLLTSRGKSQPMVCGAVSLVADENIYWRLQEPRKWALRETLRPKRPFTRECNGSERLKTKLLWIRPILG